MSSPADADYWRDVVAKLQSTDARARNWAAHVLATNDPDDESSNLDRALEVCRADELKVAVERLAACDEDWLTESYCQHILKALRTPNED